MTAWPDTSMREAVVAGLADPAVMKSVRRQLLRAVSPPFVTDLPVSPQDGDEVYYLADATNGVVWHFRYRAGASSIYRWEFVGGAPLYSVVDARESTSSSSYTNLTTTGPSITVPFLGWYMVTHGAVIEAGTSALTHGLMSYDVGEASASDTWAVNYVGGTALHRASTVFSYRHGLLTGSSRAFVAKYKSSTSNSVFFSHRFIEVLPISVGRTR